CVVTAVGVALERIDPVGRVGFPAAVAKERESSVGRVAAAGIVKFKRGCSDSCVLCAGGVKQKGCSASGRIEIPEVKIKRSSANSGVEVAGGDAKQRKSTNCRVPKAQGESLKGVVSRSSGEVRIASIGRRDNCLHLLQEREGGKQQRECSVNS